MKESSGKLTFNFILLVMAFLSWIYSSSSELSSNAPRQCLLLSCRIKRVTVFTVKMAPCFSSQASRSHSFSQETTMQGSIGLSRLVKSCVGHRSVNYCTSTNSSWAESFRQNGFIDQVTSLLMSHVLESHNYICLFCILGSCDDPTEPHSSEISARKARAGTWWPPAGSTIKVATQFQEWYQ